MRKVEKAVPDRAWTVRPGQGPVREVSGTSLPQRMPDLLRRSPYGDHRDLRRAAPAAEARCTHLLRQHRKGGAGMTIEPVTELGAECALRLPRARVAPPASYTVAIERYLTGEGIAKSFARIYRTSLTTWDGCSPVNPRRPDRSAPASAAILEEVVAAASTVRKPWGTLWATALRNNPRACSTAIRQATDPAPAGRRFNWHRSSPSIRSLPSVHRRGTPGQAACARGRSVRFRAPTNA
ncbi:hypothetical protein SHIRM173S_05331 [Streptomyces hirsutus]